MHTDRHQTDRRDAILRILRGARVRRQEDLVGLLKADGFDVPPPSRQHGSWTFYFDAPGGFTIEVMA